MSSLKVSLPGNAIATMGLQVSFVAPCDCTGVTHLIIDTVSYQIVDAMANPISNAGNVWCRGALVSALLDTVNRRAFLLNAASLSIAVPEHSHNYAGSSRPGGPATSASKLESSAGSDAVPVFFKDGVPVECSSINLNATSASKLKDAKDLQVNLASAAPASFDGSRAVAPGVTGILPTKNGGLGTDDLSVALKNMLAAGPMIASPEQCVTELPDDAPDYAVFFLIEEDD